MYHSEPSVNEKKVERQTVQTADIWTHLLICQSSFLYGDEGISENLNVRWCNSSNVLTFLLIGVRCLNLRGFLNSFRCLMRLAICAGKGVAPRHAEIRDGADILICRIWSLFYLLGFSGVRNWSLSGILLCGSGRAIFRL